MKILKVQFENIPIYKGIFEIDLTVKDRVMDPEGVYNIYKSIYTQQIISLVGINAVGKTTALKLLNLAMNVVLNNKGLNEIGLNGLFNPGLIQKGTIMRVYFYKDNVFYELESRIKMREKDGEDWLYYDEEILKSKSKSQMISRNKVFDFNNVCKEVQQRSKLDTSMLKEDDSIAILVTKENKASIKQMISHVNINRYFMRGESPIEILNVFDNNIDYLKSSDDDNGYRLKFKNNGNEHIVSNSMLLGDIISSGTIKGQNLIALMIQVLEHGGYLLVDEIENHLNKQIIKLITDIFKNEDINKKGACLIFSTHYAELLDFFDRKDNIFVLRRNKDELSEILNYSDVINRNELKKSEVILSNFIKGTAPKYEEILKLKKYLCGQNLIVK